MRPDELARYADAMVRVAAGIRPGDDLVISAELGHRELAVGLVEAAYRAGARHVEVQYIDPLVRAAQLRGAPDEWLGWVPPWRVQQLRERERPTIAALHVLAETEPGALDGIDPRRAALEATALVRQLPWTREPRHELRRRWTIVAWPTEPWAVRVYPEVAPARAQHRLARDLLGFCRLGPDDPPGWAGLVEHLTGVGARAERLSRLALERIELRGSRTDLAVQLPPGALFRGGTDRTSHGVEFAGNVPSEELYTSPDAASTEGTFRCSRPIRLQERLIEGISGEFRRGRLVRLEARGEEGEFFRRYLASVPNADRLGEIALVDRSSRIGQAGRIYYNSLIDENAVAHMAFGAGFRDTRTPEAGRRGVNRSDVHVDVMIGTDELEVTGTTRRGRRVPLIRDGAWQL
jgi:aminopeptidase